MSRLDIDKLLGLNHARYSNGSPSGPCTVRQMTPEERAKYGPPSPVPDRLRQIRQQVKAGTRSEHDEIAGAEFTARQNRFVPTISSRVLDNDTTTKQEVIHMKSTTSTPPGRKLSSKIDTEVLLMQLNRYGSSTDAVAKIAERMKWRLASVQLAITENGLLQKMMLDSETDVSAYDAELARDVMHENVEPDAGMSSIESVVPTVESLPDLAQDTVDHLEFTTDIDYLLSDLQLRRHIGSDAMDELREDSEKYGAVAALMRVDRKVNVLHSMVQGGSGTSARMMLIDIALTALVSVAGMDTANERR